MNNVAFISANNEASFSHSEASSSNCWFRWRPTDATRLQQSEALMLQGIKCYQEFVAGLNTISNVEICKEKRVKRRERDILVLIHGFAGGVACWAQNWEFFSTHYDLYAFDLPGFGRSLRPNINANSLEEAMHFFCICVERWVCEMDFNCPFILLGHSFGAFVAAHYAMSFGPSRIKLLAFADPWGINEADPERIERAPIYLRMALKLFYVGNPLTLLRAMGPIGPKFFKLIRPDFADRWKSYLTDPKIFYEYTYHCNAQLPPVGEKLFKVCCHADVASKEPLVEVLPKRLSKEIPLVVVYGSHTWMNAERGFTMIDKMAKEGYRVRADTVMNAGHQVFMDNAKGFNELMLSLIYELLHGETVA